MRIVLPDNDPNDLLTVGELFDHCVGRLRWKNSLRASRALREECKLRNRPVLPLLHYIMALTPYQRRKCIRYYTRLRNTSRFRLKPTVQLPVPIVIDPR